MAILHIAKYLPIHPGGIETVVRYFAESAIANNDQVSVAGILSDKLPKTFQPYCEKTQMIALRSYLKIGPVSFAPSYFRLASELADAKIVHLHLPNPLGELAVLANIHQIKRLIPIFHASPNKYGPIGKFWQSSIQKYLLKKSEKIIVASPHLIRTDHNLVANREKTHIIPFPTPNEFSTKSKDTKQAEFNILSVGRLVKYKGYACLIKALAPIKSPWRLTICGDGPEKESLETLARKFGVASRVKLTGFVDENTKKNFFSKSDLFVLPSISRAEAYGMVLTEAFSAGLPTITTKLDTGVSFLSRNGECGDCVTPNSVSELSCSIKRMMNDDNLRRKASIANKNFWRSHLSMEAFSQNYYRTIDQPQSRFKAV